MRDSFFSFRDVNPKEWRVNIRGRLKAEAGDFLRSQIGEKLSLFFLESSRGWFHDSRAVMKEASSQYVFFWIEDHICLTGGAVLREVISEMKRLHVDYLPYSFLHDDTRSRYEHIGDPTCEKLICAWFLGDEAIAHIKKNIGHDFYIISAASIMGSSFFTKILNSKKPTLRRWPKSLPFDFEKKSNDRAVKNFVCALPKPELFAAIDDDHGVPGYSLISRGCYPERVTRDKLKSMEFATSKSGARRFPRNFIPIRKLPSSLVRLIIVGIRLQQRLRFSLDFWLRG